MLYLSVDFFFPREQYQRKVNNRHVFFLQAVVVFLQVVVVLQGRVFE